MRLPRSNRQGPAAFAAAQSLVTGQHGALPTREQKGEIGRRRGPGGKAVAREQTIGVEAKA
jgi:hypothetical protein